MACIIKSVSVSETENQFMADYKLSPSQLLKEKIAEMRGMISTMTEKKIMKLQNTLTQFGEENERLRKLLIKHGVLEEK